ncbi:penicillin-binding transpeptidase domain-containing protein, partial [Klebsiella pneumoniae]|uniref:penicillin-binding transpeptidase domain-containing protein n=1 Tax=Klebsiella pneumoniae TaxID=573 RepID=UPI00200F85CD
VYASGCYTASFVGIAPLDNPRIVCLVKIEQPRPIYYGGLVAAPTFAKITREALWKLGVRPNQPIKEDEHH